MLRSTRLKITDLNPHLSCILCGGYFIDATTITECVHSFCRACIVRYLETSKYCPVCEVQVHKSRPLHYIRADKTLQNIVYKLVPELFHNEMKRRRELYASQPPEAIKESRDAEDRGECLDEKFIYAPDEIFSLSIEYGSEAESQENPSEKEDTVPNRRFLRCPAAVTVSHLKKFIRMKYGIPLSYEVDLQYDKESLSNEYTLMDVAYIFNWRRMGPMRFFYKIFERPPKQLKLNPIVVLKDLKIEVEELTSLSPKEVKSEDSKPELAPTPSEPPPPTPVEQEKCSPIKIKTTCYAPPEPSLPEKEPSNKPEKKEGADPPKESSMKELKVSPLKFLPTTGKVSPDSKPAVMTVAPLTKPSSSLATTSTTASNGTITHGLYTGISIKKSSADSPATSSSSSSTITHGQYTGIRIKKSPPNTLPPFRISSHLLPPRVPPLKLSPPRFTGLKESKRSSQGKKSKSSRSHDKLEMKVAQLKSASIKSVAPLVISVPKEAVVLPPEPPKKAASPPPPAPEKPRPEAAAAPQVNGNHHHSKEKTPEPVVEDDKMDIDSDSLFEGPLVIAEPPDPPPKEDGDKKTDDDEDEEIDVVDDGEGDSGRGSDASSRAEARSLSGDDDLGSPDPKTPEPPKPTVPKCNGSSEGVLDLSTCGRKRSHEGDVLCHRAKPVANPAVLDKTRQTPCRPPTHPSFKVLSAVLPHNTAAANNNNNNSYKSSNKSERNFKCHGNKLTVFNPDSNRPKIVIKNLGPRPSHERFHHHHNHHHHHQRM